MLKRIVFLLSGLTLALAMFAQQESHDVSVVNIEIPVRVFKGNAFVDNLTLEDFEAYEDGVLQKIEAVYLIRKASIEKEEGNKKFAPRVSRHFVLLFEIWEYLPKIEEALDYFFDQVLLTEDTLIVVTPMKTYNLKSEVWQLKSKKEVAEQLKGLVRRDILVGETEYRNALRELEDSLLGDQEIDEKLQSYSHHLKRLENLRSVDEKKLLEFSNFLKGKEGQKYVFLFYQKEVIPQISPAALHELMSTSQDRQDILQSLSDLFIFSRREIPFNVDNVKRAFADSSVSIHFLFITKTAVGLSVTSLRPSGLRMQEQSEDIFSAFREMANASGGLADSSWDASLAFQRAVDASENYYLIYYEPRDYRKDGKFREIKVKIKGKNYRIAHRAGYFAN